ncbi:NAD(P)H-dependent oxidoreductase [Butyrivibrio hungatei]|uniref:NADPH-dependent FMN reductase n=1 Tax=Butyrivibrio hungatei TaxID=185008 RepID=A0A1D9P005_9FIRM|nr:NAD(P)H-dependent oxidoreductase [Butyrivibrio hungatei]AOZ95966.1 NADPH-dependent FMN reductase [Butyrivibrio hungatei]
MILFINACVKTESRTRKIAEKLLEKLGMDVTEVRLTEIEFPVTSEAFLGKRDCDILNRDYSHPYYDLAKQFAKADTIVIAAPYWDLSFPAVLKQYIEHINVLGITFEYSKEGTPIGLCNAQKLYYVMTAGGAYVPEEFGFGYIKALAQNFYGIKDVELIKATGLDIQGNDAELILKDCISQLERSVIQ